MNSNVSIKIELLGKMLTMDEARVVYLELSKVFDKQPAICPYPHYSHEPWVTYTTGDTGTTTITDGGIRRI